MQTLHKQRGFLAAIFSAIGKFLASAVGKTLLTTAATTVASRAAAKKLAPRPKMPVPPGQPTEAEIKARAAMAARDARRRARRAGFNTILTSPLGASPNSAQLGRRTLLGE